MPASAFVCVLLLYLFAGLSFFVEIEPSPVRCLVSQVTNTACGADFTVWLSSVEGSSILYGLWSVSVVSSLACLFSYFITDLHACFLVCRTAGLPQYGQLGHGTDNEVCRRSNLSFWHGYPDLLNLYFG